MGRIVAIVVGLLGLAFFGFSVFDMWATLTGNEDYLAGFPAETVAWMQAYPLWRKAVWGASIGAGLLGSLLLLLFRSGLAGHLMLLAFLLMAGGFGYDLALANGAQMYGQLGLIGSSVLLGIVLVLTVAAYLLAQRKPAAPV